MKFIINATTLAKTNEQLVAELRPIRHLFGDNWDEMVKAIRASDEVTHLKHVSLTLQGDEWVLWVDDEVLTIKMIAQELGSDLRTLASWLREEK